MDSAISAEFEESVEWLSKLIQSASSGPVLPRTIDPGIVTTGLSESPKSKQQLQSHLELISHHLNKSSRSPNYYGFVTGGCTPAAFLADIFTSIHDQNVQVHLPNETMATNIEVAALNMLVELFHLPMTIWGTGTAYSGCGSFTTGATASNVIGLGLGREHVLRQAALKLGKESMSVGEHGINKAMKAAAIEELRVLTTMPHSSIGKAASIVGIGRANVINIADKDGLRIDMFALEKLISVHGTANILAISTGEVNTGRFATDSLRSMMEIRKLCDKNNVWIHVDGAFGLFGRILQSSQHPENYEHIINGCAGIEFADSIAADAHKLLNVPYDCGFYFTRHKQLATDVFRNAGAAYLSSGADSKDGITSPLNIGIENSRRFRALPVYATLYTYGLQGYVEMLERQIGLARWVADWIWNSEEYELLPNSGKNETIEDVIPQTFIIVLFRAECGKCNETLKERINRTGRMYVSGTSWEGKPAIRIAVSNWQVLVERDGRVVEGVLSEVGSCEH